MKKATHDAANQERSSKEEKEAFDGGSCYRTSELLDKARSISASTTLDLGFDGNGR